MYGLDIPPSREFEPRNPLIFLVCLKFNMLFFTWMKFEKNVSIGFVYYNNLSDSDVLKIAWRCEILYKLQL